MSLDTPAFTCPAFATSQPLTVALCENLQEIRTRIDQTDRQLVALIAERAQYVRQAARFKHSLDDVAAPQRVAEVIARVLERAAETGAPPAVVDAAYRAMIPAFIAEERQQLSRLAQAAEKAPAGPPPTDR